jgi:hypothetical protein
MIPSCHNKVETTYDDDGTWSRVNGLNGGLVYSAGSLQSLLASDAGTVLGSGVRGFEGMTREKMRSERKKSDEKEEKNSSRREL